MSGTFTTKSLNPFEFRASVRTKAKALGIKKAAKS